MTGLNHVDRIDLDIAQVLDCFTGRLRALSRRAHAGQASAPSATGVGPADSTVDMQMAEGCRQRQRIQEPIKTG